MSGKNLFEKILLQHGVDGTLSPGRVVDLPIDQTLTQDSTGTLAYLQFEAIGVPRVATKCSVSYVDHNTLQTGFQNADDHRFLQSVAEKYGIIFSKAGNGICHQVHLERFGVPGETLLGSDSHTPTAGGLGMLAIGAGGLDVAMAMAGRPFPLTIPEVVQVRLEGVLLPWLSAKDIILELLRRLTVKGGLGKIFEYGGPGVRGLSVPERATIANMGTELGATSSIFPSDEETLRFLRSQGREEDYRPLHPDRNASYARIETIVLDQLEPLIAQPHMPDRVCRVRDIAGLKIDQVAIGSCTNSSYKDMATVAAILKGRSVHPKTSLIISPGSRQVLAMLCDSGALSDMVRAGARILECACGPCIGIGQSPPTGGISLRTFNRNFKGRSGTPDAKIYLCSPEVAAVSAIRGEITDPRSLGEPVSINAPETYPRDDNLLIWPSSQPESVEIVLGPNIKPIPRNKPLQEDLSGEVLIVLGDDVTTDDILPAGTHIMSLRSNIPAIARYVFHQHDPSFSEKALNKGGGFIVAGKNYGQGSSREHAAIAPMFLGIRGVIARSFARIHRTNLINFGVLPLLFDDENDHSQIQPGDKLYMEDAAAAIKRGDVVLRAVNMTKKRDFYVRVVLNPRERAIVLAGGLLNLKQG
nr:aconitate hydratase [Desulfobacterales bacterium]